MERLKPELNALRRGCCVVTLSFIAFFEQQPSNNNSRQQEAALSVNSCHIMQTLSVLSVLSKYVTG
jgi:hypothetical protein